MTTNYLDPMTTLLLTKAIDGLHLRQTFIAQNIANASTVGYIPIRVSFEEALRAAANDGPGVVERLEPRVFEDIEGGLDGVRLDMELASASETALRFSGLIEVLGRHFALQRLVVSANGRS
jgi:flagellar basal-body rod protein FlgB